MSLCLQSHLKGKIIADDIMAEILPATTCKKEEFAHISATFPEFFGFDGFASFCVPSLK
jgi:hypothetical protein